MTRNQKGKHASPFSLRLQIPPVARYARSARSALSAFANHHKVAPLDLEALMFALGEALANAIERSGSSKDIEIAFSIDDEKVVVTVSDRGCGLAWLPPDDVPMPEGLTERGRGFAIMQRCTDFFDASSVTGIGTIITLGRYRRNHSGTVESPLKTWA